MSRILLSSIIYLVALIGLWANQGPLAICHADVIYSLPEGECIASISVEDLDAGSYDPDGDALTRLIYSYGGPFEVGTHYVFLWVSDGSLSNSCYSRIEVQDNIPVEVDCRDASYTVADPETLDMGRIIDNLVSNSDGCLHLNWQAYEYAPDFGPSVYDAGVFSDLSGVSADCQGTVTINDGEPQVYCTNNGLTTYEHIANVSVRGSGCSIDRSSGADGGYHYEPAFSAATLYHNFTYQLTYSPGFRFGSYNEYWRVYLDLNRDGDFTDSGELLHQWSGRGGNSTSFRVPSGSGWGYTRLRVVMRYGGYGNSCQSTFSGEVEDYSVYISPYIWFPWFRHGPPEDEFYSKGLTTLDRAVETEPIDYSRSDMVDNQTRTVQPVGQVFPNPAQAGAEISVQHTTNVTHIRVRNVIGRLIGDYTGASPDQNSQSPAMMTTTLQLPSSLASGIYLVSGFDKDNQLQWTKKLSIQ